jgi:DNA-binding CsgD family transcriptional regulator
VFVGRGNERAALRSLLESVEQGMSSAIVLRGEVGIGKTALLDYAAATASPGLDVKRLDGLESEAHLGFAALHRLLIPYHAHIDRLPPAQAQALQTALGLTDGRPVSAFLLGLAVLSLLADVTHDRPAVWIVDDAQWLDAESLEILAFAARRVYAEQIGFFFGVRDPSPHPVLEGIPVITVNGLADGEAADLLVSLAPGMVDRQVAERVAVKSHGNPLVITEVSRELNAGRVPGGLLLDDPLPLSERLVSHFRQQIAVLPADCRALLLYAAALPEQGSGLLRSAAERDGLDPEASQAAVTAGLVEVSPVFRFRHSLIRSAVYTGATGPARRHAHKVLADLTDGGGDADRRAWHLAAASTGPDESVAIALERGAHAARARGGFLAEAAHLARAAELSPNPADRAQRCLSAARAALTGGAPMRAQALLEAGLPYISDPFLHAQARKLQANALHRAGQPGHDAPATLLAAAGAFTSAAPDLARETMLEALEQTFVRSHAIESVTPVEVGRAALSMAADGTGITGILLESAGTFLCHGYVAAAPLMRRALTAMADDDVLSGEVPRWFALGLFLAQLMWDEKAALSWLLRCERLARRTGALDLLFMTLMPLSGTEATLGQLTAAEARVADVRLVSRAAGMAEAQVAEIANSRLLAWQGRDDAAAAAALGRLKDSRRIGAGNNERLNQLALLVIAMGRTRYCEAFDIAKRIFDEDVLGLHQDVLPYLVESAARSGHRDEAERALSLLRERARASGTDWALGLLARSEALLADDQGAEACYQRAIAKLKLTVARTDLARARLLYGEWLRRQKRRSDARDQLRLARDMFDNMGAAAFAERAAAELKATGEHAAAAGELLTPQEAQVARLAAAGATNQEIATQLFISSHTVEYHLRKVFRKLGVTSRRKLARELR